MSGQELIEALSLTGTGKTKLETAARFAEQRPAASAEELLAAMTSAGPEVFSASDVIGQQRRGGGGGKPPWPEGTAEKARRIIGGQGPLSEEIQGKPPPQSKEAGEERLARAIGEQLGRAIEDMKRTQEERQAQAEALQIGRPQKPKARE